MPKRFPSPAFGLAQSPALLPRVVAKEFAQQHHEYQQADKYHYERRNGKVDGGGARKRLVHGW